MVILGDKKALERKQKDCKCYKNFYHSVFFFKVTGDCRDGWTKFQGSCYLFASDQASWPEAEVNASLIFNICFINETQHKKNNEIFF